MAKKVTSKEIESDFKIMVSTTGNVFKGTIVEEYVGNGKNIITLELDPDQLLQLTISYIPAPAAESFVLGKGNKATIVVPVPDAIVFRGN